jgi:hypothetical protein
MNGNPLQDPNNPPETDPDAYEHDDGRMCWFRPYWTGNIRDGHWKFAYWYRDEENKTWRYCGRNHG